ncbi:hypothetical protein N0V83_000916 [Neocucurbitaria cava]|uniref:Uncharacterized protein n=1 Tax=Neocucurbitaria cava TaxID=798079 RepID=A0A9W8YHA6_9PLEO|nr:hypothetical protein N0V83_000916 [Neocucurbitaria cava]
MIGGILPKDIADGSFTRRIPTSNDKLLEQLIGKKRAKAHLAAKQEAARPNAKVQRHGKPATQRKDESEDEEEGRAATFKSKRRKGTEGRSVVTKKEGSDDENEDEESRTKRLEGGMSSEGRKKEVDNAVEIKDEQTEAVEEPEGASLNKKAPSRSKAKPKSFLDEILAERSKKKNRKSKD